MGMLPHRGSKVVSKRYFLITDSHVKHRYHDLTDNKGKMSDGCKNKLPINNVKCNMMADNHRRFKYSSTF